MLFAGERNTKKNKNHFELFTEEISGGKKGCYFSNALFFGKPARKRNRTEMVYVCMCVQGMRSSGLYVSLSLLPAAT